MLGSRIREPGSWVILEGVRVWAVKKNYMKPEQILEPAQKLGGRKEDMGDFAVTIPAFPRVPITLVFWKQDEEFEARLTILFDRTVLRYLPTEDIVLSAQMMAYRLIGMAGKA